MVTKWWTYDQAWAWVLWRDPEIVERVSTTTAERLLQAQRRTSRLSETYDHSASKAVSPSRPNALPIIGSKKQFERAIVLCDF
jgi:hypothetical protein